MSQGMPTLSLEVGRNRDSAWKSQKELALKTP